MDALKSLRRRFPGIDTDINRMVCDMANAMERPIPIRGWIEVRPGASEIFFWTFAGATALVIVLLIVS